MDDWNGQPRISTDFTYRGIDAAVLENEHLRVMVLTGKGGDILEFRDKETDIDLLWHTHHNWQPPEDRPVPSAAVSTWLDHYPGGWQMNLPVAGFGREIDGNAYGLHGESALIPWDAEITRDDGGAVTLELSTELVRYPFYVERQMTMSEDEPRLEIDESITNRGGVDLEYSWMHHVALGPPLVGPGARLDVPDGTGVVVDDYRGDTFKNGRLEAGAEAEWPMVPGRDGEDVDLRGFPPRDSTIHDLAYLVDFPEQWVTLTNQDLDVGFGFHFPSELFECAWYWQPFGGFEESPYFNRNYNVGIEASTSYPAGDIPEAQRRNGTMKTLGAGETVSASFSAVTYPGREAVESWKAIGLEGRR